MIILWGPNRQDVAAGGQSGGPASPGRGSGRLSHIIIG